MARERLTIPVQNVRDYAYELAYTLASRQLAEIKDIQKQCRNSGAKYIKSKKSVAIDYLNEPYHINTANGDVIHAVGETEVPMRDKILILHYFLQAKGTPLTNNLITYKELHDGINYYPTFFIRAIQVIVNNFGKEPGRLLDVGKTLGGHKADYGDFAITINAFKYVPITIALWQGDDEFAPEGNIMFDSTISDNLPTEDITVLCEVIAWKMVRVLKERGDSPGSR